MRELGVIGARKPKVVAKSSIQPGYDIARAFTVIRPSISISSETHVLQAEGQN